MIHGQNHAQLAQKKRFNLNKITMEAKMTNNYLIKEKLLRMLDYALSVEDCSIETRLHCNNILYMLQFLSKTDSP